MKFNECSFVFLFIVVVLNRLTHVEVAIDWTTGQLSNELKIAKAEVRIFHKKSCQFFILPIQCGQKKVKLADTDDDKKKQIDANANNWAREIAPRSGDVSKAVCDEEKFAEYTGLKIK